MLTYYIKNGDGEYNAQKRWLLAPSPAIDFKLQESINGSLRIFAQTEPPVSDGFANNHPNITAYMSECLLPCAVPRLRSAQIWRWYLGVIKTVITDNEGGAAPLFCCVIAIIGFQLNIHLSSL